MFDTGVLSCSTERQIKYDSRLSICDTQLPTNLSPVSDVKNNSPQLISILALTLLGTVSAVATPQRAKISVKADSITGHYREKFSGDTLDVKLLPGGKIKIDLNAYYPSANPSPEARPGGPNIGETTATFPIKNGFATYSTEEFGGKCKITFAFSPNKVEIKQDEDTIGCCGYGMNVNASGTYKKLSNRPKF
jgi:hypothetical protein